jgi:hypothetical protein
VITIIESPYYKVPGARRFLACCLLDCYQLGESPWASHVVGPLALPEHVIMEDGTGRTGREIGIAAGSHFKSLMQSCNVPWCIRFYDELRWTVGMSEAQNEAVRLGYPISPGRLSGEAKRIWYAGEWPTMARLTPNHVMNENQ